MIHRSVIDALRDNPALAAEYKEECDDSRKNRCRPALTGAEKMAGAVRLLGLGKGDKD